jgi:hypothetical protein
MKTGETYVASGKFEFPKVIIATLVGIVATSILGVIYAVISEINPFIYLQIVVLGGLFVALSFIIRKILRFAKSRNVMVNLIVGLIICFFAWYAHWCFYYVKYAYDMSFLAAFFNPAETFQFIKDFSEVRIITVSEEGKSNDSEFSGISLQICYLIEFAVFMASSIANRKPDYFSEEHQCFYTPIEAYVEKNEAFNEAFDKAPRGCYNFLSQVEIYHTPNEIMLEKGTRIVKLNFNYCEGGKDDSILTMTEGKLKVEKRKKERSFSGGKKLIKDMYVNAETEEAILKTNVTPENTPTENN